MTPPRKIRILLADDHSVVRTGVAFMVNGQTDMTVVGEAENGAEALRLFSRERPDVAVIDLKMPDMSGIDCTKQLREAFPQARVVILTTYGGDENIFRALQAGASAYLLKDMGREEILGAIRAVHAGETCLPPSVAASLAQRLSKIEPSPREIDILRQIALGDSNKEIGSSLGISESTVKGHVNHLLNKLQARDRTEAVTIALRRGLISLD